MGQPLILADRLGQSLIIAYLLGQPLILAVLSDQLFIIAVLLGQHLSPVVPDEPLSRDESENVTNCQK